MNFDDFLMNTSKILKLLVTFLQHTSYIFTKSNQSRSRLQKIFYQLLIESLKLDIWLIFTKIYRGLLDGAYYRACCTLFWCSKCLNTVEYILNEGKSSDVDEL